MKSELHFEEVWLPFGQTGSAPRCNIFVSKEAAKSAKLMLVIPGNHSTPGQWVGNDIGSMMPFLKLALQNGFGIVVLNPNVNSRVTNKKKVVSRRKESQPLVRYLQSELTDI
jgi:hypothetical protein